MFLRLKFVACFSVALLVFTTAGIVWAQDDTDVSTESMSSSNMDFLFNGGVPTSTEQLREMENQVAELSKRVKPATVNIQVDQAQGSGVVVSRDGLILTAAHVIGGPNKTATITFPDGTKVKAKTLGVNSKIDSGMLKISKKGKYPYLDMGISESLKDGQWVVAVGHPGGIDNSRGLVVRVGRLIFQNPNRVLTTDCTLVGGDSGGPLFDMNGEVIGIHSRIGGRLSDNIHVPIDIFHDEWDQLEDGKVIGSQRGRLGFNLKDNSLEVKEVPNGPAKEAGMKKGDIILKIDGKEIENRADLFKATFLIKPNQKVKVLVRRKVDDEDKEVTLTIKAVPK